ncbi:MAG: DUF934 domain-containing protein [Zoogloeaceae bacterium]|jgi:uncharacterized protein (DUF934 family)|nr:DUF934 domain-containing protein [Zoogloeaceae bacterium]
MSTLIKNGVIVADPWTRLANPDAALPEGDLFVPLTVWHTRKAALLSHPARIGLWLETETLPEDLAGIAADLSRFAAIAIYIPRFVDGRGYSLARLLRERYRYTGELRAVGDVLHDQLFALWRVGFDAWALKEGKDAQKALQAFATFRNPYQADTTRPPLFRRRGSP